MRMVGKHIILREPQIQDSEILLGWENSKETIQVSSHSGGYTKSDIERYINGIKDVYLDKQLRLMICRGAKSIGTIDLFDVDFDSGKASIGILIAEREDRNNGIGSESLSMLMKYCIRTLGLGCLNAKVQNENFASISFFKKMGFKEINSEVGIVSMQLELR